MIPDEALNIAATVFRFAEGTVDERIKVSLEAAAPRLMAAAWEQARTNNDHIESGAGAYSSGFHYALDCIWQEDDRETHGDD